MVPQPLGAHPGAAYLTEHGPDLTAGTPGTHVIEHAGRLLALCEANLLLGAGALAAAALLLSLTPALHQHAWPGS